MADIHAGSLQVAVGRKLHIGAKCATPGWETLNVLPLAGIDHVTDARNLTCFPDNTFTAVYASHVLEHFDYRDELLAVVREWYRVLAPGGQLLISVPDLDMLCQMFSRRDLYDVNDRLRLMRMMFGGHCDTFDYHLVGLNAEFLTFFLKRAGFSKIKKIQKFCLFDDTSSFCYKGEQISLNLVACKPNGNADEQGGLEQKYSFSVTKNGKTYPFRYYLDTDKPNQKILAQHIQQGELYQPEVSLFLMRVLQEGDSFIDVGANVGFFSVMAGRLVGQQGWVCSFEYENSNFRLLKQNFELNELRHIDLYQAIAGECSSGVAMLAIDDVLSRFEDRAKRIKIIKVDTNGYEHHVLMGAIKAVQRHKIPFVMVKIYPAGLRKSGSNVKLLQWFMREQGYQLYQAEVMACNNSLCFSQANKQITVQLPSDELSFNAFFCLSGELEQCGFTVIG